MAKIRLNPVQFDFCNNLVHHITQAYGKELGVFFKMVYFRDKSNPYFIKVSISCMEVKDLLHKVTN